MNRKILEFYDVILQNGVLGPSDVVCTDTSSLYDYPFIKNPYFMYNKPNYPNTEQEKPLMSSDGFSLKRNWSCCHMLKAELNQGPFTVSVKVSVCISVCDSLTLGTMYFQ